MLDELRYLRTPEAAQYIGISRGSLERWRLTRDGPPFVRIGKSVRYRRLDLDKFMDERLVMPQSERTREP